MKSYRKYIPVPSNDDSKFSERDMKTVLSECAVCGEPTEIELNPRQLEVYTKLVHDSASFEKYFNSFPEFTFRQVCLLYGGFCDEHCPSADSINATF